jgi:hypothetical protein
MPRPSSLFLTSALAFSVLLAAFLFAALKTNGRRSCITRCSVHFYLSESITFLSCGCCILHISYKMLGQHKRSSSSRLSAIGGLNWYEY